MRPIDADNLKRLVKEFRDDAPQSSIRRYVCNVVLSMLGDENQTPTIDAVPLTEIYRVIAGHSDYHGDNILAALTCIAEGKTVKPVRPLETGSRWIPVEEDKPKDFVSVLGHMTDAGDFPSVRECYLIDGQHFFFPALNAVHPVDKWKEMPPAIDTPAVDAVEVIRCGDCKFRCETDDGEYNPEDIVCTYWATDGLKACDFCSYGERRADD